MNIQEKIVKFRQFADENLRLSWTQLAAVVVLSLMVMGGAGWLYWRSIPLKVVDTETSAKRKNNGQESRRREVKLVVHVAGAVISPGLYELKEGLRVGDAIKAAGGPRVDADLDALNLAAKIIDGQKIMVPAKMSGGPTTSDIPNTVSDGKIPLNSATLEQLDQLDGIGPVTAKRIIDYRNKNGPFTSISQLRNVVGIGEKKYDRLKDHVSLD